MSEEPCLYSARDFAETFPAEKFDASTWMYWLNKWREAGELRLGADWKFEKRENSIHPVRVFLPRRVLRMVWKNRTECFFCQQLVVFHGSRIKEIMEIPQVSRPIAANPPPSVE